MTRPTTRPTNEEEAREAWGRYFCRRCADCNVWREASERHSMGIFAGTYCGPCWAADGRNHDRPFDPMDAGEAYSEEGY
jgi:late competence protein required for DNA uptake (superfamily II DNA/RNA helicase)